MALKSKLRAFGAGLPAALDAGSYQTAKDVATLEYQLTPEDSGDLKASEHIEPAEGSGNGTYRVVAGGGDVDYPVYVEKGNSNPNYPAQPYAEPAARAMDPTLRPRQQIAKLTRKSKV